MRRISYQSANITNRTSSKGNQGKYHIGNEWIKTDYLGYEAAAEYLASELLRHANIPNYVSYSVERVEIENRNGYFRKENACVSQNFLPKGAEIVTLDKFLKQNLGTTFEKEVQGKSTKEAIKHVVDLVEKNTGIRNFGEYLTSMFEFDALILNEDRHVQNIVLIVQDGKYTPGPIFDNGASFLSDITQEYPLEEKTNRLIACVKAKPFNTSFAKQVEACHELYGKRLTMEVPDISKQLAVIRSTYGERIADRMQYVYDVQIRKNKELLQLSEPAFAKEDEGPLYTEEEMFQEIKGHLDNGGEVVAKSVPESFVISMKKALMEEEIPFVAIRDEHHVCNIFTKDTDSRAFLKVQKDVFTAYQPPKIEPEISRATESKVNQIKQMEEHDDR